MYKFAGRHGCFQHLVARRASQKSFRSSVLGASKIICVFGPYNPNNNKNRVLKPV